MTIMSLCNKSSNYVGQVFAPGFGKMLAKEPWFADACERGCECPQCPSWLAEYLTAEGFDDAKIREMLKDTALHAKVCLLMHNFRDHLGMTMQHATDAEWGAIPDDDNIVQRILTLTKLATRAVNCVVQLELYTELHCNAAPFLESPYSCDEVCEL